MRKAVSAFGFIEIIIVLAIISFLAFKLLDSYYKKAPVDKETQKMMIEQGIDTTSYKSVLDSTRSKLKDVQDIQNQREKELEKVNY